MKIDTQSLFKKFGSYWMAGTSIIGTLLILFVISIFFLVATSKEETSTLHSTVLYNGGEDQIAVVDISGVIVDEVSSGDPFALDQGVAAVRELSSIFEELARIETVKAVVLRINSPGGAVVASDELYQSIKELSEEKVVIAQLNDTAASGGYYAAVAADKIIANRATITGSIGVIAQFPEFTALLDKVGVDVRTFKSGDFKDIGAFDREMTEEEQVIIQSIIDDAYVQFIDAIESGRELDREEILSLADGRIYSGIQAKEAGLVDEVGTYDDALKLAASEANVDNPSVVQYNQESFFSLLFSSFKQVNPTVALIEKVPSSKFGVYYMFSL
jgi:protease-4